VLVVWSGFADHVAFGTPDATVTGPFSDSDAIDDGEGAMRGMLQIGVGPLGRCMVRAATSRGVRVVGAVDPDPDLAGRDLGDLCDVRADRRSLLGPATDEPRGRVAVVRALAELPLEVREAADLAVVTTFSDLARVAPQIDQLLSMGLPVVTTCEELSYPWVTHCDEATVLDAVCRRHGVACLGTGVNPGFLMDFLPAVHTGLCREVRRVTVRRIQDAASRRRSFQDKIGAGLSLEEARRLIEEGVIRHVGLRESALLLAAACGWSLQRLDESIAPVVAESSVAGSSREVERGAVAGVEQWARGYLDRGDGEEEVVALQFRAAVGQPEPRDEIVVEGTPPIRTRIEGGVDGDAATCAVVLNVAPLVAVAEPGLHTMLDLPIPTVGR